MIRITHVLFLQNEIHLIHKFHVVYGRDGSVVVRSVALREGL